MFKTRLQELCHQRMWPVPNYTVSSDGPAHDLRFSASVTVNGVKFHAPGVSKLSKEAQSKAAQVAIDHFAANPLLKPSPQTLEEIEKVGLPKGDAAKVALSSLSLGENQNPQNDSRFYKNLLQELATKEGMPLPKYTTVNSGASRMPIFSSTVEIGGESFVGDIAKIKKQAEMNAAKVAWFKLKERLYTNSAGAGLSSSCLVHESHKPDSSGSQSKDIRNLELPKSPSISPSHVKLNHNKEYPGKKLEDAILLKHSSGTVVKTTSFPDYQGPYLTKETTVDVNVHTKKMAAYNKLDAEVPMNKEVTVEDSISQDGTSTPSSTSHCSDHPVADVISESPVGRACSSLLCNRVRVYPSKPDMVLPLPNGAISLPLSDDMWIAVSLDFSNHEGGILV